MRTGTIIAALLVSGLAVAGCSPNEQASSQPPAPGTPQSAQDIAPAQAGGPKAPNQVSPISTDRQFAQQLLAFDQQAKELTDLAKRSSEDEHVKHLAEQVEHLQEPIKDRLDGWLRSTRDQAPGSAPENQDVGEMTKMPAVDKGSVLHLQENRSEEFERQLTRVIGEHLEHTVEMSRTELEDGSAKPMRDLAEELIASREPLVEQAKELQAHL